MRNNMTAHSSMDTDRVTVFHLFSYLTVTLPNPYLRGDVGKILKIAIRGRLKKFFQEF